MPQIGFTVPQIWYFCPRESKPAGPVSSSRFLPPLQKKCVGGYKNEGIPLFTSQPRYICGALGLRLTCNDGGVIQHPQLVIQHLSYAKVS